MQSITRRTLLKGSALLAAKIALRATATVASQTPTPLTLDATTLARYVDPLPIPEVAEPKGLRQNPDDGKKRLPYYRLPMRQIESKLHRDLPATRVWGFASSSPGPTIQVRSGQGILVEWANELPSSHFLPIDHTLHGAEVSLPDVRSVIHLHGGRTPANSDGYPEDWYIPGQSRTYHYPNLQPACSLFYHDHTMGINRLNIYSGLMGLFFVRDEYEDSLNLPKGPYEIPLLIYDRLLRPDGQLYYPVSEKRDAPWVPEVFGDLILVNGKLYPYLDVEPREYRLRITNGSNGRFYRLSVSKEGARPLSQGQTFQVIGTEQGLLLSPAPATRVVLAPAERIDLVVDFSGLAGENVLLRSDAFDIMQFRVASKRGGVADAPSVKALTSTATVELQSFVRLTENDAVRTRRLTLDEQLDLIQHSMGMLLNNTRWHMPITEKPVIDTTEIWELVNLTDDSHPIHLHLVRFQILDRRPFDTFEFQDKGTLRFTGPALLPDPTEGGWKDTVRADPGMVTRIIIPFKGYPGRYVWHCHILEHEDNEMMRPYEVATAGSASS